MGRIRAIIICGMDVLVIEWTLFCTRWDIIGLDIRTKCEKFMDPKRGGGLAQAISHRFRSTIMFESKAIDRIRVGSDHLFPPIR